MSRRIGPVCRLCRREGVKLFLKGSRCDSSKCAIERRDTPPGMHFRRRKVTDYGLHLREKQKVKHYYGVLEKVFRIYFKHASNSKGNTGDVLMSLLERRLDNTVHRLGFGLSRRGARQLVSHGHISVNGHKIDVASYQVKVGDIVRVTNRKKSLKLVQANLEIGSKSAPDYLTVIEGDIPEGRIDRLPEMMDVSIPVNTSLIIELCSK